MELIFAFQCHLAVYLFIYVWGCHTQLYSGLLLGFVLRDHSWNHMGIRIISISATSKTCLIALLSLQLQKELCDDFPKLCGELCSFSGAFLCMGIGRKPINEFLLTFPLISLIACLFVEPLKNPREAQLDLICAMFSTHVIITKRENILEEFPSRIFLYTGNSHFVCLLWATSGSSWATYDAFLCHSAGIGVCSARDLSRPPGPERIQNAGVHALLMETTAPLEVTTRCP